MVLEVSKQPNGHCRQKKVWAPSGSRPSRCRQRYRSPSIDSEQESDALCVVGQAWSDLLEQGMTVNSNVYCEQLENTRRALRNRRIPVVFLDDNAKPHRSRQTLQKLEDMGWEHLEHPPYSPDLSPSDFYLFRSLEHWLRGKKFRTIEEMRESLTEFFDSKDREWYRRGIHKLEEQWQKVIESGGEYFDY
jgi:[histone H3]-lysine36 N-dimethyltransferase SETMAR